MDRMFKDHATGKNPSYKYSKSTEKAWKSTMNCDKMTQGKGGKLKEATKLSEMTRKGVGR